MQQEFNMDLFYAVLLKDFGIKGEPKAWMPDWEYNALAFAQANDIEQFVHTPEYQIAELIAPPHHSHGHHHHFAL